MRRIVIVGCNSMLYKHLKTSIEGSFEIVGEISHKEIRHILPSANVVIFSFDTSSVVNNIALVNQVRDQTNGRIVYISTSAIFSCRYSSAYKYPNIKREVERHILSVVENSAILRVGIPNGLTGFKKMRGQQNITQPEGFIESLTTLFENDSRIENAFDQHGTKCGYFQFYFNAYSRFGQSTFGSKAFKAIDLVHKLLGYNNYGYTLLSNYGYREHYSAEAVVGGGLSAFAYASDSYREKALIFPNSNRKGVYALNMSTMLESNTLGGNSDLWHGVVSKLSNYAYSNKEDVQFRKKLKEYYKLNDKEINLLNNGYSFVPYFPLRPKHINDGGSRIIDGFVDAVTEKKTGFVIHTDTGLVESKSITLALGAISLLSLLGRSNFLQTEVCLDDHMVGYFGQVRFDRKRSFGVQRCKSGHFKRYTKIELENGRSIFVTLRPAYGRFKDIHYASRYRDTFSSGTIGVVMKLFQKLSLALIGEAVYNKLGLGLSAHVYNIVGHIETIENVSYKPFNEQPITYKMTETYFSEAEKDLIKEGLPDINDCQVNILNKVLLSPGLHFVNANKELQYGSNERIKILSSLTIESSVEHPTFTQLIRSIDAKDEV